MADDDTDISFMDLRHFAKHFVEWQKEIDKTKNNQ